MSTTEREQDERFRSRRGNRSWRNKDAEFEARYRAATNGGEFEHILDDIEEREAHSTTWDPSYLASEGYAEKAVYPYLAPDKTPIYEVLRFEHRVVPKAKLFVQRRVDQKTGQLVFGAGRLKIPYRWPDLVTRPTEPVHFTEGEKDSDTLAKLGLVASTLAGQKWSHEAVAAFRGRDVVVLEDNDEQGRENAANAVERLLGVAKSLRVVRLPGLKHGEDVTDWLDAGHTKEKLVEIVDATRPEGVNVVNILAWQDAAVPEREWALPNRIPLRHVTLFSGEGAAGKSLLALMLAAATALGREWLGAAPQQGNALFIDAEDEPDELHRRLTNILAYYGAGFADVAGKLHIASLVGKDAVLGAPSRKAGRIEPTTLYAQILEMAGDLKPRVITVASSANVFAGNENDRGQVMQFVALLVRLAIAANGGVVPISHPSLTGKATDSGLSGSTGWHNGPRARMYLKAYTPTNGEDVETNAVNADMRTIEFRKNQYGPMAESIVLRFERERGLFVPVSGISANRFEREQQAQQVYVKVLAKLTGQNQDLGPSPNSPTNYAPKLIAGQPEAKGFTVAELVQAQQRLLDDRLIHIATEGKGTKARKRIRLAACRT
jgi:RecA-family ATPase